MCLSQCLNSVPLHGQGNGKEHNVFVHQLLLSFLSKHQLLYIVKGVVYCLTNRDYTLHHRLYMVKSRCVLEAEILNWIFFFSRLISKRNTCMQKFCIKNRCVWTKFPVSILFLLELLSSYRERKRETEVRVRSDHVSWATNQHIRIISDGSCDSEDWSNDSALTSQE